MKTMSDSMRANARPRPCPSRIADRLVSLYRKWENENGVDLPRLAEAHLRCIGIPPDDPLAEACRQTAVAVMAWEGQPYHSAIHHAEVATNVMMLAQICRKIGEPLTPRETALLLVAALAHDLGHDGTTNNGVPFRLEERAALALDAICIKCAVQPRDRAALQTLVLSTDPVLRPDLVRLAEAFEEGVPEPDIDLPRELGALARRPRLAAMTAMLSDADLLSSAGLTKEWSDVQSERLSKEWGKPVDAAAKYYFFEAIVGPDFASPAGRVFSENLQAIRQAVVPAMEPSPAVS